jgi:hypothetical protein
MGDNPPSKQMIFGGNAGVYGPQNTPMLWPCIVAATSECFKGNTHPQHPKNLYLLAWGIAAHPFNASSRSARPHGGCLGADSAGGSHGWLWLCWLLLAVGGYSKNCLRKYFFHSYVEPIHS